MPPASRPCARKTPPPPRRLRLGVLCLACLAAAALLAACSGSSLADLQQDWLSYLAGAATVSTREAAAEAAAATVLAEADLQTGDPPASPRPSLTPFQATTPTTEQHTQGSPAPPTSTLASPQAASPTWTATSASPSATHTPTATSTLPGYAAAEFTLAALNASGADQISLGSLKGKPAVLTFFATWCPDCRKEIPLLSRAYARHKDQVQFVAVDLGEPAPVVKRFIQAMNIPYPVLLDPGHTLERSYQIRGIPTTYFIDANGRIVSQQLGGLTEKSLQARLSQLIGP